MDRRNFIKAASAAGISVVAMNPMAALAQTTSLRIATWLPPQHHMPSITLRNWIEQISAASDGSLKLNIDPAPIAPPPEQYNIVRDGAADLAYHVTAYTPGPFEVARGVEMPFMSPSAEVGSQAAYDWYDRNIGFDTEFSDVKVVSIFVHGPGAVHSKKPVKTLEDLANLKIRVGGGGVRIAEALGAAPVAIPAPGAYESLQKGVTEAAMFPWESIRGFKLNELVSYHTDIPGGLYTTFFAVIMNRAKYDALSDEHKQVLDQVGGVEGARILGAGWDAADEAGRAAKAEGAEVYTLPEEEVARWAEKLTFVEEDWVKLANERGHDGAALLEDLKATIAKYS